MVDKYKVLIDRFGKELGKERQRWLESILNSSRDSNEIRGAVAAIEEVIAMFGGIVRGIEDLEKDDG